MGFTKSTRLIVLALIVLLSSCSNDQTSLSPDDSSTFTQNKNGTETLGPPDITMASGSGLVEAGIGMVGVEVGQLDVNIPDGVTINQVILYWAGGTTNTSGDDTISIAGQSVPGALIGGPVEFYSYTVIW